MESPDAAEGQRIVSAGPLAFEVVKRPRNRQAIPFVGDIQQAATPRAGDQNLVDTERGRAVGINATLESVGGRVNGCDSLSLLQVRSGRRETTCWLHRAHLDRWGTLGKDSRNTSYRQQTCII